MVQSVIGKGCGILEHDNLLNSFAITESQQAKVQKIFGNGEFNFCEQTFLATQEATGEAKGCICSIIIYPFPTMKP